MTETAHSNSVLSSVVEVEGVGLHSGESVVVELGPCDRLDIEFSAQVLDTLLRCPARWDSLSGTARCTALVLRGERRGRVELRTVEHLMSVLMAMGLPPLKIRVLGQHARDSYELPVLDGSSAPWIAPVTTVLGPPRRPPMDYFRVTRQFEFRSGDAWIRFEPVEKLICEWICRVDFGPRYQQEKVFLQNWLEPLESWKRYCQDIAPARTFGFCRELGDLARRGLARGGSLANALLLDDDGPTTGQSFKVESELAAHKLLDAMGDFGLAGRPLVGRIRLFKAGHALHLMALKEAFQQGVLEASCLQDWI